MRFYASVLVFFICFCFIYPANAQKMPSKYFPIYETTTNSVQKNYEGVLAFQSQKSPLKSDYANVMMLFPSEEFIDGKQKLSSVSACEGVLTDIIAKTLKSCCDNEAKVWVGVFSLIDSSCQNFDVKPIIIPISKKTKGYNYNSLPILKENLRLIEPLSWEIFSSVTPELRKYLEDFMMPYFRNDTRIFRWNFDSNNIPLSVRQISFGIKHGDNLNFEGVREIEICYKFEEIFHCYFKNNGNVKGLSLSAESIFMYDSHGNSSGKLVFVHDTFREGYTRLSNSAMLPIAKFIYNQKPAYILLSGDIVYFEPYKSEWILDNRKEALYYGECDCGE